MKTLFFLFSLLLFFTACYKDVEEITNVNHYGTDESGKGYTLFALDKQSKTISKINYMNKNNPVINPYITLSGEADKITVDGNYLYVISSVENTAYKIGIKDKTTYSISFLSKPSLFEIVSDNSFSYISGYSLNSIYRVNNYSFEKNAKLVISDINPKYMKIYSKSLYVVSNNSKAAKKVLMLNLNDFDKYIDNTKSYSHFPFATDTSSVGDIVGMDFGEDRAYFVALLGTAGSIIYSDSGALKLGGKVAIGNSGSVGNCVYSNQMLFIDRASTANGLYISEVTNGIPKTPKLNDSTFNYIVSSVKSNKDILATTQTALATEDSGTVRIYNTSYLGLKNSLLFSAKIQKKPISIAFW